MAHGVYPEARVNGIYAEGMDALSRAKRIIFSLRAPSRRHNHRKPARHSDEVRH